ncbi:MAG: hypothetical protein R2851_00695 [Caldilineaceae bacterium]
MRSRRSSELLTPDEELHRRQSGRRRQRAGGGVAIDTTGDYLVVARANGAWIGARTRSMRPGVAPVERALDGTLAPGVVATDTLRPRRWPPGPSTPARGDHITATVRSGDFDAFAELLRRRRGLAHEDDNSAGGEDTGETDAAIADTGRNPACTFCW